MKHFNELGLSKQALDAVARMGYREPTPVQEQAIPLVLAGRDIIAAAKTGTGKTGAFSLPALDALGHAKGGAGPLMLVVTPTRELAQQIGEVCGSIALSTHHRIVTVVGGLSYQPQIKYSRIRRAARRSSPAALFRNLRRAGRLPKSSSTCTRVLIEIGRASCRERV